MSFCKQRYWLVTLTHFIFEIMNKGEMNKGEICSYYIARLIAENTDANIFVHEYIRPNIFVHEYIRVGVRSSFLTHAHMYIKSTPIPGKFFQFSFFVTFFRHFFSSHFPEITVDESTWIGFYGRLTVDFSSLSVSSTVNSKMNLVLIWYLPTAFGK